jgi:predicted acetyltransferase
MDDITFRLLQPDERAAALTPMISYAFRSSPPEQSPEAFSDAIESEPDAVYAAAFEGPEIRATAVGSFMTQNVRGKTLDACGVWGVTSHPQVRRRGIVRRLMNDVHTETHSGGAAVSVLYPFQQTFYERLGYVILPQARSFKLSVAALAPTLKMELSGDVELVKPADAADLYLDFLKRQQQHTHGMVLLGRSVYRWSFRKHPEWLALAKVNGDVCGAMAYRIDLDNSTMAVSRMYAENSQARYLLLNYMARHVDQVETVAFNRMPPDARPETWLPDLKVKPEYRSSPMGRVLDIMKLNGIGAGDGQVTLQITDPHLEWNNGVFTLSGSGGLFAIEKTDSTPDCTLSIQALSALVYGAQSPDDFVFRAWGDPPPAISQRLAEMFPLAFPHVHEEF